MSGVEEQVLYQADYFMRETISYDYPQDGSKNELYGVFVSSISNWHGVFFYCVLFASSVPVVPYFHKGGLFCYDQ